MGFLCPYNLPVTKRLNQLQVNTSRNQDAIKLMLKAGALKLHEMHVGSLSQSAQQSLYNPHSWIVYLKKTTTFESLKSPYINGGSVRKEELLA